MHTEPKLKPIIFVDYLQIIRGDPRAITALKSIGQISNDLKQMAKEFDCPVVCLSQLNRGVEIRDNKRPVMSDLRDSGNIEQDADVIGFLYRDDYYNKETDKPGLLEINIAKHRNGPTGTTTVRYVKETGILHNIDWQEQKRRAPVRCDRHKIDQRRGVLCLIAGQLMTEHLAPGARRQITLYKLTQVRDL